MKLLSWKLLLIILPILLFISCEVEVEEFGSDRFAYDYFPLETGRTWVYQVDSIIYDNEGASVDTTTSFVKEEIVEEYINGVGDTIFTIERYWRPNPAESWKVTDVWTSFLSENRAIRVEENLMFVKFVFPPLIGKRWDSNVFINESVIITVAGESIRMFNGWDNSRIISLDESEQIGDKAYDQISTVLLTDDEGENVIERRYALEKYARGVGLVYKEYEILDSQCSSCTEAWEEKAEKGFILKQTLVEYN